MKGSGGTEGGTGFFFVGLCLAIGAVWFFFDSVRVGTGIGWVSGLFRYSGWHTTSMGIVFVPFFLGTLFLFYDASKKWAWWLTGMGIVVIVMEIISQIRFYMNMKTTHLLLIIMMFAAGTAFMLRSYGKQHD